MFIVFKPMGGLPHWEREREITPKAGAGAEPPKAAGAQPGGWGCGDLELDDGPRRSRLQV